MTLTIGSPAPDFEAVTLEGPISFHEWLGDSWAVLFSHPRNFTPVCTTELGYMASIKPEFDRRGVKVIGLSVDPVENHGKWAAEIEQSQGTAPNYPLIADQDFTVAKAYGMLPAEVEGDPTTRTPADNATVRNVFVIGPDKTVKLMLVYPMTTGRNFDEVLRVIDSLQLTASHKVATPAQWTRGGDVIIAGSVSNDQAKELFGDWKEPLPYLRVVPDPTASSVRSVAKGRLLTSRPFAALGSHRWEPSSGVERRAGITWLARPLRRPHVGGPADRLCVAARDKQAVLPMCRVAPWGFDRLLSAREGGVTWLWSGARSWRPSEVAMSIPPRVRAVAGTSSRLCSPRRRSSSASPCSSGTDASAGRSTRSRRSSTAAWHAYGSGMRSSAPLWKNLCTIRGTRGALS